MRKIVPFTAPNQTKYQKVLNFIRSQRNKGATFTEIQRFVVELNGMNYDEIETWTSWTGEKKRARAHRGYWCDNLSGNIANKGLLPEFCVRVGRKYYIKGSVYAQRAVDQIALPQVLVLSTGLKVIN